MSYLGHDDSFPAQIEEGIIYSKYQWYNNELHSYLKVPFVDLIEFKVQDKISQHSYVEGDNTYLEADVDAYIFIDAVNASGKKFVAGDRVVDDLSFLAGATKFGSTKKPSLG